MFSCFIIDDEQHPVELLTDYISRTPELSLLGFSLDPVAGLQELIRNPPDLLFLDVDMPVLSGFDLHKLLEGKCTVVFTTAFPKYAVEAYTVDAMDFLLKPIRYERFLQCVRKVIAKKMQEAPPVNSREFMFVQTESKSKLQKIRFDEINYIEGLHNYLFIHLDKVKYVVYISLKEILEKLPPEMFFRIHRSYIINYAKVRLIEGNRLWLETSPELTIGSQYKDAFFERVKKDQLLKK